MAEPLPREPLAGTLEGAARGINRELVKLFDGDISAAAEAVDQLTQEPGVMAAWATRMLRRQAEEKLREEFLLMREIVEKNEERSEEKRVPNLDRYWLAAWRAQEERALEHIEPFSFESLPESMKATAARGMAMAYLTYTMTEKRKAS